MIHVAGANKHPMEQELYSLMDTGSSTTLIHRSALPPGCVPEQIERQVMETAAGTFTISQRVQLFHLSLPEFSSSLHLWVYVFDAPCQYDMIVGREWIAPNRFNFKFDSQTMEWLSQ